VGFGPLVQMTRAVEVIEFLTTCLRTVDYI